MAVPVASVAMVAAGLAAAWALGISWWWALGLGAVGHGLLLAGIMHPRVSWMCRTVYRTGPPQKAGRKGTAATETGLHRGGGFSGGRLALSFDDGPDPGVTPAVLAILRAHGVRATFCVIGRKARRYPELVRAIAAEGHELGNHSYLHPRHIYLWGSKLLRRDTALAQRAIERACGVWPRLYRPPVGFRSPAMGRVMAQVGLVVVTFSVRGLDTIGSSAARIARRVTSRFADGAIIVLHDGGDRLERADRAAMLEALPEILSAARAGGYAVGPVSVEGN